MKKGSKQLEFEKLITKRYNQLSKGQRAIADYIKKNSDDFSFMTAAEVGAAVGVSESTVVRFAKALGYQGFTDLSRAFQESLKKRLTTRQRFERSTSQDDENNTVKAIMHKDVENIKSSIEQLDAEVLDEVVKQIKESRKIYILGNRSSKILADYLYFYLNFIFDDVHLMSKGPNDIYDELVNIGDEDLLVVFSFPRYARATYAATEFAFQRQANIIAITDDLDSPINEYCNLLLTTKHNMSTFIDSLVAPMSLLNALIIALSKDNSDILKDKFDILEEVWAKNEVYKKIN